LTRKVWLFEFRIHGEPNVVSVESDLAISSQIIATANLQDKMTDEDRDIFVEPDVGRNEKVPEEDPVVIESLRSRLLAMTPLNFEHLIKDLLVKTGFEKVTVTKYSQDCGIDVNAFTGSTMWPIESLLIQIQAKRWLHSVGRREVAELRGSLQPFARGAVVTTSHFSKAAIREANESGKNPITLMDGYKLASLIKSVNLRID
jgi:restriction system protein